MIAFLPNLAQSGTADAALKRDPSTGWAYAHPARRYVRKIDEYAWQKMHARQQQAN
jgi:hypothetical protein